MKGSTEYLRQATVIQENRAKEYDTPGGERSMAAVVKAFNALFDANMTETQGWQFMVLLKVRRLHSSPEHHEDSAIDEVSYSALAAESSAKTVVLKKPNPDKHSGFGKPDSDRPENQYTG